MNAARTSVALLLGNMGRGGVEAAVMNYVRCLAGGDLKLELILHEGSAFPQRGELEALAVNFHTIPSYSRPLAYHRALLSLFKQRRYTIVHAHISTMNLFPLLAAWRARVPVRICHNHSTAHWGEGLKTLAKHLLRLPARLFATDCFACGEYSGRWMFGDRLFNAGRIFVLPNAIHGASYAFSEEERREARFELGLDDACFVAGHVGRFVYPKNHHFLLDIFAAIKRMRPHSSLLLIGEGPLEARIAEQAKRLGLETSVKFLGTRDDMGKCYSALDVLLLPSFYEGMPLVAVEAQANGLPCLFSDAVSREVLLAENVKMLPLRRAPEVWAAGALQSRRCAGIISGAYEVETQAETLRAAYRHLSRRALGPG